MNMTQEKIDALMRDCTLCPRNCHVNRMDNGRGFCGQGAEITAARASLHFWEDPVSPVTAVPARCFSRAVIWDASSARTIPLHTLPSIPPGTPTPYPLNALCKSSWNCRQREPLISILSPPDIFCRRYALPLQKPDGRALPSLLYTTAPVMRKFLLCVCWKVSSTFICPT